MISEDLLQLIWLYKLYELPLKTLSNKTIEVLDPGLLNEHSGPDFFNAKIRINETMWVGNVEIHLKSSDWFTHGHHTDSSYNNTILHVVLTHDKLAITENGQAIESCKPNIPNHLIQKAHNWQTQTHWLKCEHHLKPPSHLEWIALSDRLLTERLMYRSKQIDLILQKSKGDLEYAFLQLLGRAFGFGINSDAFSNLIARIPKNLLLKNNGSLELEALFFGISGLMPKDDTPMDEYTELLFREYKHLKAKHKLKSMDRTIWRFSKTHFYNFPTVRIAQLASILASNTSLFSNIMHSTELVQTYKILNATPSSYWQSHYNFGKKVKNKIKTISKQAKNNLIINTVIPSLFVFGKLMGKIEVSDQAFVFLRELKAENNAVIKVFKQKGLVAETAYESQALLQLKTFYCDKKACFRCNIGKHLLSSNYEPAIIEPNT